MCSLSASGVQKPQFWANVDIWGLRPPFTDEGQIWCAIADPTVYAYVPILFRSICPLAAKNPNFVVFWTSAFCGVASCRQSEKFEHGYTTAAFPYPTASKSFLYSNAFMAKSHAQTLTFKSVTNKQTNRQTKKLNVFGHPGGGCNPSPTKLGMVIEDLEHVLSPFSRFFHVWWSDA